MIKRIPPDWNFGDPITRMVEQTSRGISRDWLRKAASCFTDLELKNVPRRSGETLLHLNALGDFEYYSCNSNTDAFLEKGGDIQLEQPRPGCPRVAHIDVGNVQTHPTFVKYARVYKDHNNRELSPSFGPVHCSAHNDRMKRVELIVGVRTADFADDLQKLASGEQIEWSMSTNVPHDICSFCGNRAKRASDYCEHIRDYKGQITKQGNVICMLNDHMRFFDISRVRRRADRIALTLRKVAGEVATAEPAAAELRLPLRLLVEERPYLQPYLELVRKLAAMEKDVPAQVSALDAAACSHKDLAPSDVAALRQHSPDTLLHALDESHIMLSLPDFVRLLHRGRPISEDVLHTAANQLPGMFGRLLEAEQLPELDAQDECGMAPRLLPSDLHGVLSRLTRENSLADEPASRRVTILILHGGTHPAVKTATVQNSVRKTAALDTMIRMYAGYQLRFCERLGADDRLLRRVVLSNYLR